MLHKADFFKGDSVGEPLAQIYFGSHVLWNQTWFYLWGKLNYRLCSAMILILTLSHYTVLKWIKLKWLCGVNFKPTSSIFLFLYTHIYIHSFHYYCVIVLLSLSLLLLFCHFLFRRGWPQKEKKRHMRTNEEQHQRGSNETSFNNTLSPFLWPGLGYLLTFPLNYSFWWIKHLHN